MCSILAQGLAPVNDVIRLDELQEQQQKRTILFTGMLYAGLLSDSFIALFNQTLPTASEGTDFTPN